MNINKSKHTINQIMNKSNEDFREDYYEYYEPSIPVNNIWQTIKDTIKSLYCNHDWGNGKLNTFRDCQGNYSATYICSKCGKRKLVVFGSNRYRLK